MHNQRAWVASACGVMTMRSLVDLPSPVGRKVKLLSEAVIDWIPARRPWTRRGDEAGLAGAVEGALEEVLDELFEELFEELLEELPDVVGCA